MTFILLILTLKDLQSEGFAEKQKFRRQHSTGTTGGFMMWCGQKTTKSEQNS